MGKKVGENQIDILPLKDMRAKVERALVLIAELKALFPLVTMTEDDRKHSQGRLRDGETAALTATLDVVDLVPKLFESLADKDEGYDPNRFESDLLRERLERRELLARVDSALAPIATRLSDSVLFLGGLCRPAVLAAYRIAKTVSATDKKIRAVLAPAIDFYGRVGKAAATTRAGQKKPA